MPKHKIYFRRENVVIRGEVKEKLEAKLVLRFDLSHDPLKKEADQAHILYRYSREFYGEYIDKLKEMIPHLMHSKNS